MSKRYRVTITKVLEDFWGMDDLIQDLNFDGYPDDVVACEALALLLEDIQALLEGAEFNIEAIKGTGGER